MSTTNGSAGVEMMKVRVLSHVVGGITTSVRVSKQHVQTAAGSNLCRAALPVPDSTSSQGLEQHQVALYCAK
jgi:hypothetical protein